MTRALDDIRFLADSQHRPVVIDALADGPRSRDDLREVTGASSATVGRLVADFEARGWLVRDGRRYELTTLGAFVREAFDRLHREMVVAGELHPLLPGMPFDEIGIGIDRLADARVTRATESDPLAIASRIRELELTSRDALSLTDFFPEPCIDGRYEAIVEGTQTFEAVFSPEVVETAMASEGAAKFAAIVAAERTDIRVYEEPYTHRVLLHDGVACLIVRDPQNVTVGLVETADETVVEWVTEQFERHQAAATPLTPERLATVAEDAPARA